MASNTPNTSGVTVKTAPHNANKLGSGYTQTWFTPVSTAEELLKGSCEQQSKQCKALLESSFQQHLGQPQVAPLYASSNGFVKGAVDAYNQHHHFVIRPEDGKVWFAILTQFSCYVNAHAEELRSSFVAHDGQVKLEVKLVDLSDFGLFACLMGQLLREKVVDPELSEWILPAFSTTTRDDVVVASVLMMGTLQKYFSYTFHACCGLPSVTLLGTKGDWENILLRLEKLQDYGAETTKWFTLLKPVLTRFVMTFQSPDSEEVLDFWQKIVHKDNMGSGPTFLSGWITAFCFWDKDGKLMYQDSRPSRAPRLTLDGALYHRIDIKHIPLGYRTVPVHVNDNGNEFDTTMIAGSVGIKGTSSGRPLQDGQTGLDTLQPVTGWLIYQLFENKQEDPENETVGSGRRLNRQVAPY